MDSDQQPGGEAASSRRSFLRTTGLAGLGAAALSMTGTTAASAATPGQDSQSGSSWRPDTENPRFTLVVMPDTQYLFDGASINPEPVEASFRYLLDNARDENIVFMAHLGDLVQNGQKNELEAIGKSFEILDRRRVPYSVLAGNHDIDSSTDDQRGPTPYLDVFGPQRFRRSQTFKGASPDGYNSYHMFHAAGRDWLLLALDWRPSAKGIAWANDVIRRHPKTPVILTIHELVYVEHYGDEAQFSDFGARVWNELVAGNDQIFLTLNGHYWPPARTTKKNNAGHDVHVHITNYQDRYYGGSGMIRLYRFDLARNTIDVETISPWLLGKSAGELNVLERQEIERTGSQDYFSVAIDFEDRFSGFDPVPPRSARPAAQMLVPGTVAYWRFDGSGRDGAPVGDSDQVKDLSGHGNDLTKVTVPGSPADVLKWSSEHHPDQPGHGSLYFGGNKSPLRGAYLQTASGAPLNTATFESGYTVEAFFKIPDDWDPGQNQWAALLSRWGMSREAGKTQGDPDEPVVTLSLSDGPGLQWAVYPLNQDGPVTNWGHDLTHGTWWHVAVVNDGNHTTMYVDGCPVARNPSTKAVGLSTAGMQWLLGGYEYGGKLDQVLHGWVGDVRIVERALKVGEFMLAR
ncbi:LamG domain-containing protein [Planotetraspora sp. A-T 1434]|uniref:LamG-like jellyroll fold domain-containing protein n=1 Tax=Planotetraspora sp. A-T 1434 TaxID=2979219 RepID=UPI0021BFC06F|nr:LamG-like jellyroll fold domain-containing protein [Planotetraspora sp. A-T 1434]MCT9935238.1 LamG domain-containing protein [Planotetraspora sp. A-T 1434]